MMTPEMKAHSKMQRVIRNTRLDLTETCFAGKSKMTMSQLRNSDEKNQKVKPSPKK